MKLSEGSGIVGVEQHGVTTERNELVERYVCAERDDRAEMDESEEYGVKRGRNTVRRSREWRLAGRIALIAAAVLIAASIVEYALHRVNEDVSQRMQVYMDSLQMQDGTLLMKDSLGGGF